MGSAGPGTFNQSGGTVIPNGDLNIARFAGATGTYNLDGGTLVSRVTSSTGANAVFNFNGGVLMAAGDNTTFMGSLSQANVRNGGAVVDTTNFNVTIVQSLQHSPLGGDNAIDGGLTKRGNGAAGETPLAGFPHHALDAYLPKLLRAGYRVAICEQLEDPKYATGMLSTSVSDKSFKNKLK